jgi:hypothetical protein
MQSRYDKQRKTCWRLLIASAAAVTLLQTPVGGQTAKSQPATKPPQAKSPADDLPDLPATLATKLKPVGNGRVFVVAAPRTKAAPPQTVKPPVRRPPGGSIAKVACMHNTRLDVTAEYPVLICHPWLDDIRATSSGSIAAEAAPAPSPGTPPASASASASSRQPPSSTAQPESKLSYRVRSSRLGLMVCSYARMPVVATLQKRNITCENPNAFAYQLDIAGVSLNWTGDPEMRPADLRYFDEPRCRVDVPTSCSGASTCTPLCGAGAGPSPTPVGPPGLP